MPRIARHRHCNGSPDLNTRAAVLDTMCQLTHLTAPSMIEAMPTTRLDWPSTGPDDPLHRPKHARALKRVRAFCLALPDAAEKISRGHMPIFTARAKNAVCVARGEGRPSLWVRAAPGVQDLLTSADPGRYFVPAFVGGRGWVGVWLDTGVDWGALEDLLRDAHQLALEDARPKKRAR
jgi:hypothetical protein